MAILTAFSIGTLFSIGVFLVLRRNIIRSIMGLILMANAVNLFLLSTGAYSGLVPPYINSLSDAHSDALPQALILTAIVISMGATAFILAMLYIITSRYKTNDSDKMDGLKN